ncbi:hypothetical protein CANARDRAFT_28764 [[Candida] arabinofermentans NRRL YB-2248]|uniref:Uncharacterized protein n=1 Tax=[Candida] arabinofermentans NRRL YB-2248 TaxID=983967 RepID=A0A1E4SZY1_9ASCO|nr:hypothetical protein CANARDRAFT_28764 [[Candida] arabinofermentans NRRL YB-2248]
MSSFFGSFTRDSVDIPESELEEGSFEKYLHEALEQIKLDTVDGYEKADVFLNQAVSRYEAGDNSSIDKKLAALAYEYKGAFDFLKADSANAAVIIKKALKLSPRPRSHVLLALIAAEGTDFDPNSPNTAYTDVAYKEALGEFQKAIELDANSKDIYYNYGQIFYLIGDLASAKEKFEKAKELNPDNVYAYIQLACIAYKQGEISTCQALFKDAKRRFPVSPDVINYYGEILYDMKDFDGAEKQFDNAIKLQDALPTFNVGALPLINKALICKERQDIESHELYLARACQLDQKNETAREHLSVIYTAQKKFDECDKVLDEACAVARSPIDLRRFVVLKITNDLHRHVSKDRVLSAKLEQLQREVATQYAAAIASGAAPPQGM